MNGQWRATSRTATARNLRSAVGPAFDGVDEVMVDRVHAMSIRPGNREAFIDLANTDQIDRTADIPRITTPTLVLRSESIAGQYFSRDVPGAQELTYVGGGHLLPEEAPEWVAVAIRDFLAGGSRDGQKA
ncbi:alpha/beta hydrolase [Nocardia beijingensis]|uniref:alpha/beta fold hydrolase n=1 Tax=Nocardia beijingensis TaxID=95162 RepID=UPI00340DC113